MKIFLNFLLITVISVVCAVELENLNNYNGNVLESFELQREKRSPQRFQTLEYRRPPPPPPRPIRVRRSIEQNEEDKLQHETQRTLEEITREKRSPQRFQTLEYRRPPPPPPKLIRARRSIDQYVEDHLEHAIEGKFEEIPREKRSSQSFQTLLYRPPPTPPPRPIRVRRSIEQNEEDKLEHETQRTLEEITREKRSPQRFQTLLYRPPPPPPPKLIRARRSIDQYIEDHLENELQENFQDITREKRSPQSFQTLVYRPPPTPPPRPIRVRRSPNKLPTTLPK